MIRKSHLSLTNALKEALTHILDNFAVFFFTILIWASIFALCGLASLGIYFMSNAHSGIAALPLGLSSWGYISVNNAPTEAVPLSIRIIIMVVGYMIIPFMNYQLICMGFALHKGEALTIKKAFSVSIKNFFLYYAARILLSIKMFLGFILFIVPGIYFGLKNFFAGFSLVDDPEKTLSEDAAMSHILTEGVKWRLMLVYCVQIVVVLINYILLLASLIFPPAFLIYVILNAAETLVDVEIFKQLQSSRLNLKRVR